METKIENFKTIVEKLPVGVIIFDKLGNPVFCNEAFEKMWGIKKEDLESYNLFEDKLLKSTNLLDQIKQVFEGKPSLFLEGYYDTLLEQGRGYKIWVETTLFPLFDD